ncbi:MAG: hypothetical protein WBP41_03800 [Saprospiraceae bacterium]
MSSFSIDLHCHPTTKPFAKSFKTTSPGTAGTRVTQENCIWHQSPPDALDRLLQRLLGLSKFTQSDFTSLAWGDVRCICASLYSVEKGFVDINVLGEGPFADVIAEFASSLGSKRVDFIQNNNNYFSDLVREYEFLKALHKRVITLIDGKRQYILVKNFIELDHYVHMEKEDDKIRNIYVVITIEGLHDLNSNFEGEIDEPSFLRNLATVKNWEYRPFFITYAHHFNNKLCGHAQSLYGFPQHNLLNQKPGMNTGFTPFGWDVLKILLDNEDDKQIHIDIKHMSVMARKEYIKFLKTNHAEGYAMQKYPLIISHGACNGKKSDTNPTYTPGLETTAARMFPEDINFYDEEIVEMARSGGIIGLQLDERRIASRQYIRTLRVNQSPNRRMHSNSKMLWNNIQHIIQLLDMNDIFAWKYVAIGSDFDGMIDPINMFWTAEEMDKLLLYTEQHAEEFFNDPHTIIKNQYNRITASEVVDRIFRTNAFEFFRTYFK